MINYIASPLTTVGSAQGALLHSSSSSRQSVVASNKLEHAVANQGKSEGQDGSISFLLVPRWIGRSLEDSSLQLNLLVFHNLKDTHTLIRNVDETIEGQFAVNMLK